MDPINPTFEQVNIYNLTFKELSESISSWGEPGYRARQVWDGLYRQLWMEPDQFTNLPKSFREELNKKFSFSSLTYRDSVFSKDLQTEKSLFRINGGNHIETVLMLYEKRQTLCVSTQSGCGMGCVFCASGQMGFKRNLSAGEIIEQVIHFSRLLREKSKLLTNIVYMGMGEPFQNFDAVMKSINILNDPNGLNIGERRFTVSTVGLIPGIQKFTEQKRQINLAISLHAPSDDLRNVLVPINKKYGIADLLEACQEYVANTGRRISFEYALINNVNDGISQANALSKLIKNLLCHVNLIRLNPSEHFTGTPSSNVQANLFRDELQKNGIPCTIRLRRGIEINAGCGQLAYRGSQELVGQ